jgi:ribosomal protein S12 methylthiotransferase
MIGKELEVMIEEPTASRASGVPESWYLARSQWDAPEVDGAVYVRSKNDGGRIDRCAPGSFVRVKITDTMEYDLIGEVQP